MAKDHLPDGGAAQKGSTSGCEGLGHLVVVPILELSSFPPLIDMASSLACPEDGRVVALFVAMGEPEQIAFSLREIDSVIEPLREDGRPVELLVHTSSSITRGILDVARELGADLLVLDARLPAEGGAKLGTVAENVIPVSPCPVILFRPGESAAVGRIVVPILEGHRARSASQLATVLGQRLDRPIEALLLETEPAEGASGYWEDGARRDAAFLDPSDGARVTHTVLPVKDPVEGFVSHAADDDLAVTDIDEQDEWEAWLRGDTSLDALRLWPGGFLFNASQATILPRSWWQKLGSWLKPTVTQFEGAELEQDADEASYTSLDYLVLIIIAAILAAFGLTLNSGAVIIGAMLVAPLMTPLIAFATGLTVGKIGIMLQAAGTLLKGIIAALLVALLIGWISTTEIVTPEMAGRGNVTFLDMGVALASGFIGAYAKARKDISSAIAGIAIAAALMPPLVTVGLALAFEEWALAEGAALLFLTNIVSITLAAWITLFWLGLRPGQGEDPVATRRASTILVVLLVGVLVGLTLWNLDTLASSRIETVLHDAFQEAEVVRYEIRQSDPLEVVARVRQPAGSLGDSSEIVAARDALEELLDEPVKLSVILEPLVDADVAAANMEAKDQIDRILRQTIRSGQLIDSVLIAGNPTFVIAVVSTDADPDSEPLASEIKEAEAAMTEALGLPVQLQILTTEAGVVEAVEASNAAFASIIEVTLNDGFGDIQVVDFTFEVGNPFVVQVTIRTELDPTSDEFADKVEAVEADLSEALGIPVLLVVDVQASDAITATPTATGAATPSPTAADPTEEAAPTTDEPAPTDQPGPEATAPPPTAPGPEATPEPEPTPAPSEPPSTEPTPEQG
jgi:uncharacterized hydrophobic protein (TIGR00271 family)